jgi:hypothetical protein
MIIMTTTLGARCSVMKGSTLVDVHIPSPSRETLSYPAVAILSPSTNHTSDVLKSKPQLFAMDSGGLDDDEHMEPIARDA